MPQTDDQGETSGEAARAEDREGAIADLIPAAKADRAFPLSGSPDDIRKRLNEMRADSDMHAVVDDAETNGLSY